MAGGAGHPRTADRVDPVTHTLVGGVLAESGLRRRTALGAVTLIFGAILPDVDVVAYAWGPTSALWLRRGITHGLVALLVLPLLLTAAVLGADRLLRRGRGAERAVPSQILLLAFLGVATHPLLDLLNTYGVRLLVPFSDRWLYGDTLFIADPWVWLMLGAGVAWSWRRRRGDSAVVPAPRGSRAWTGPARWSLAVFAVYVCGMAGSNLLARSAVRAAAEERGIGPVEHLMVSPVAVNPLRRRVVLEANETYWGGTLSWSPRPTIALRALGLSREPDTRAVAAIRGPRARHFLSWARFPYFVVEGHGDTRTVIIGDARYTLAPAASWASARIDLGGGAAH